MFLPGIISIFIAQTSLGEALGEFYVAKFFPDESKQRALRFDFILKASCKVQLDDLIFFTF